MSCVYRRVPLIRIRDFLTWAELLTHISGEQTPLSHRRMTVTDAFGGTVEHVVWDRLNTSTIKRATARFTVNFIVIGSQLTLAVVFTLASMLVHLLVTQSFLAAKSAQALLLFQGSGSYLFTSVRAMLSFMT